MSHMSKKFVSVLATFTLLSFCLMGAKLVVEGMSYQEVLGDDYTVVNSTTSVVNSTTSVVNTTTSVIDKTTVTEPSPAPTTIVTVKEPLETTAPLVVSEFRLEPDRVVLQPLGKIRFIPYAKLGDQKKVLDPREVSWSIERGGGRIDQYGVFQAWDAAGDYEGTIVGKYAGKIFRASVKIEKPLLTSGSSSTGTTVSSPMPSVMPTPVVTQPGTSELPKSESGEVVQPTRYEEHQDRTLDRNEQKSQTTNLQSPRPSEKPVLESPKPQASPKVVNNVIDNTSRSTEDAVRYDVSELKSCLLSFFTNEEYAKYFDPNGEKANTKEIDSRLSAAERCYKTSKSATTVRSSTEQCLVEKLGLSRYQEISSSVDVASKKELFNSSGCFTKPEQITYQTKNELDPNVESCLRVVLSDDRVEALKNGQKLSASEKILGRECFSVTEEGTKPPQKISASQETITCLEKAVGTQRYQEIQQGENPTSEERKASQSCFSELEETQREILPTPVELMPFVPQAQSRENASVAAVSIQDRETKNTLTLSGTAVPNSIVDIYIFSDPIVVSTTADANGNWSYELYYHLPEGNHKAYTIVDHPDQGKIKSELVAFDVVYAQTFEDDVAISNLISVTPVSQNASKVYVGLALIIVSVALMALLGIYQFSTPTLIAPPSGEGAIEVPKKPLITKDGKQIL